MICTIFFVSGLGTLLQTILGDRLPIIQGGSFAFIPPTLSLAAAVKAGGGYANEQERFLLTMQIVSGGVIGSGIVVFFIGATGLIKLLLRLITPITGSFVCVCAACAARVAKHSATHTQRTHPTHRKKHAQTTKKTNQQSPPTSA